MTVPRSSYHLEGRGIPWLQRSAEYCQTLESTLDNVDMFTHIPLVYSEAS